MAYGDQDALLFSIYLRGPVATGHAACYHIGAKDDGNRKFILIETEDYADKITAERVRRVMKGVPGAKDEALKNGFGGSFTFCELGEFA